MMTTYTYTIFDANPHQSSGGAWPSHENVEVEADSAEGVLAEALMEARTEGEASGAYENGDRLWVLVWNEDEIIEADGSIALDIEEPFDISEKAHRVITLLDFGEVEDYYSDDNEIEAKREAWDEAREAWEDARDRLLDAKSEEEAQELLGEMSSIENEWGDDPETRRARQVLGL